MKNRDYIKNRIQLKMKDYLYIKDLPDDWASYEVQKQVGEDGSPTEMTIRVINEQKEHDIVRASEKLIGEIPKLAKRGLQDKAQAPGTFQPEEYKEMVRDKKD